jgi:hypothetical protein
MRRMLKWTALAAGLVAIALPATYCYQSRRPYPLPDQTTEAWKRRQDAMRRARVFVHDAADIASADFTTNPGDLRPFDLDRPIDCRYVPKESKAVSAKFDCRLPDGALIKVKYGGNWEIPAEVAATRLLAALGFAVDRVSLVKRVHCRGCPPRPFAMRRLFQYFYAGDLYDHLITDSYSTDFEWVSVERKLEARPFETDDAEGWSFTELDAVDPAAGGASRAEIDALRLMAVFLSHFDNKPNNQRLVCREEATTDASSDPCRDPVLMLHDVGGTFGPRKAWFHSWRTTPMWRDAAACETSMAGFPLDGVTFRPVRISDAGRRLLASRLAQLSPTQILALFAAARFPDPMTGEVPARNLRPWVDTFLEKVDQLSRHPGCPQ